MNVHLNSREIAECAAARASSAQARHAAECELCGAELARLEQSLTSFRHAVREWSRHEDTSGYRPAWRTPFLVAPGAPAKPAARAGLSSLLAHAAAVAAVFTLGTSETVTREALRPIQLIAPRIFVSQPKSGPSQGGGGGGQNSPFPASYGKLPKPAARQFVPPAVEQVQAELLVPPSILVPAGMPEIASTTYGDPFGKPGIPSGGPGTGGGIGSGRDGGVGPGRGPGVGPGEGGGINGGPYRIGGGVSAPVLIHRVEPEYSDSARKAKWQGTVVLAVVIDAQGRPIHIRVVQPVGMGLDEKAIEAVQQWRFRPAVLDRKAVPVFATVEVTFRLL